jgi:2-amino-4-hydroxy-6-hydroxymethyldihydropteridine diphosphokinase
MTPAYIALGSNLADPLRQLTRAVAALQTLADTQLVRTSSVYRSPAVGPGTQPDYLNAVLLLTTRLAPRALLEALHDIERAQGRVRDLHWGPRPLDLDLLLYGAEKISTAELTVPHPRMQERNFVLYPLREVCGANIVLPDGASVDALLRQCPNTGLEKTSYLLGPQQHKPSI